MVEKDLKNKGSAYINTFLEGAYSSCLLYTSDAADE